jgi:hypothetical protein
LQTSFLITSRVIFWRWLAMCFTTLSARRSIDPQQGGLGGHPFKPLSNWRTSSQL